ncbi:hypothetical protein M728_001973 [Ensifer sp. WSM1721]
MAFFTDDLLSDGNKKGRANPTSSSSQPVAASTSVVNGREMTISLRTSMRKRSKGAQIFGGRLARTTILSKLEAHFLTVLQCGHASAFYRRDVHEHVGCTVVRLDKPKALGAIEPFYRSRSHFDTFQSLMEKHHRIFSDVLKPILSGFS